MFSLRSPRSVFGIVTFFYLIPKLSFALPTIGDVTSTLPRDIESDSISQLDFELTIAATTAGADGENLWRRLKIYLAGSNQKLGTSATVASSDNPDYYVDTSGGGSLVSSRNSSEAGKFDLVYSVTIKAISPKTLGELLDKATQTIKFKVEYFEPTATNELPTSATTYKDPLSLQRLGAVPQDAPTLGEIDGSYAKLVVNWDVPSSIKFTDDKTYPPPKVNIIVISEPDKTLDLSGAAYVFNSQEAFTETKLTTGDCTYTPVTSLRITGGTASSPETTANLVPTGCDISCTGADRNSVYFNLTQLKALDGRLSLSSAAADAKSESAEISNLENGNSYAVVLYYAEDGIARSSCKIGTAVANETLAEASGEGQAKKTDIRCFIASAAFGTALDRHVDEFRWVRDHILLKLPVGQELIDRYYRWSPPVAQYITEHPMARALALTILWPLAVAINLLRLHFLGFWLVLGSSLLLAIAYKKSWLIRRHSTVN